MNNFPGGVDYAFGYGSGVLRQQPPSAMSTQRQDDVVDPGMIDVILAIDDPRAWHGSNLRRHSDHYSLMARLGGPCFVTWLQREFGAELYFHPFVNMDVDVDGAPVGRQIKYGVVTTDALIRDLARWDYLYLAGRMHKPIVPIERAAACHDRADEVEDVQRTNLLAAVSASLLLQDGDDAASSTQSLPIGRLYNTIASLSYTGDFRMQTGAEDPNKVQKLVETPGMSELWDAKYSDTLGNMKSKGLLSVADADGKNHLECNLFDESMRRCLVQYLPPKLRIHSDTFAGNTDDRDSIRLGSLALRRELANIVAPAARSQGAKGFFTAGLSKSLSYAMAKFAKGRRKS